MWFTVGQRQLAPVRLRESSRVANEGEGSFVSETTTRPVSGLAAMKLDELKGVASSMGIKGTTKMRKSDLVEAIKARQSGGERRQPQSAPAAAPDALRPGQAELLASARTPARTAPRRGPAGRPRAASTERPRRPRRGRSTGRRVGPVAGLTAHPGAPLEPRGRNREARESRSPPRRGAAPAGGHRARRGRRRPARARP